MPDDNTALYFADGRAFGATHAAPALTDDPEVGRRSAGIAALASDLAHERAAHQLTVLELTAAREEAGVTLQAAQAEILAMDSTCAQRGKDIDTLTAGLAGYRHEIADLKARLLGMTACAADAALTREGAALARMRRADALTKRDSEIIGILIDDVQAFGAGDEDDRRDADFQRDTLALLRRLHADRSRASVQTALEDLAETVTGRPYPEVSAELDQQVSGAGNYRCPRCRRLWSAPGHGGQQVCVGCISASPDEGTEVIDDPDAIERVTPDEIADALKAHREQEHVAGAPFVALGDLVADLIAVTREIEAIERVAFGSETAGELRATSRRIEPLLVRRDTIERALVRAVAR